ncbi:MAG TPA: TetR/AcrR family transcriptional regulator [Myxococcales bacterium]|nr:TetR/AcrR family transcriptional regulator [Myxococcales bacterium]
MARPKSEDRRAALLDAASAVFAESGLGAPTSQISSKARVSEGSLFTYFKTKDELINELYRDIRFQLADAVMAGFPRRGSIRERLEHIWSRYVTWGTENPTARRALKLVSMSHAITDETRAESGVLFAEVQRLQLDAVEQRKIQNLPPRMVDQALKALAEMTMDLIEQNPKQAARYRDAGFQMLWGALTSKS